MAADPDFFLLDRAIGDVWSNEQVLDDPSKTLICDCLPRTGDERPHGEEELDVLQLALSACDLLSDIGESRIHWLSEHGQAFPGAVRRFIYDTALKFHEWPESLPEQFIDPLAEFIHKTESHVATLNYDNLLYRPLIEKEILSGYSGALVDGFHSTGFNPANLERKYGRTFGHYLHLHGSPLFIDRDNSILKLHQCDLAEQTDTVSSHIVLTHFRHKPTVISSSTLLLAYWRKLVEAVAESAEVILFGYSGADDHLNSLLHGSTETSIRVVEWDGAGEQEDRVEYWSELLSREVTIIRMSNILEFTDW
jgi:hypothetical protein